MDNMTSDNVTLIPDGGMDRNESMVQYYHGIATSLRLYVTPVILFGGTVGNVLTIIVILTHHFRATPSSVLLGCLAFVDIGVLYFNLLDIWLGSLLGGSLQYTRDLSEAGCKFGTFVTVFLTHYSSWLLVLINCDRVVCVWRPLKARAWCSRRRLVVALITTMFALALISVHLFWTTEYHEELARDRCHYNERLMGVHGYLAWLNIDASLFVFIPFLLI